MTPICPQSKMTIKSDKCPNFGRCRALISFYYYECLNRNLEEKDKYMANIITGSRILCSILLLFVPTFSPAFYMLYLIAGFTDMIDGTIARKTHTPIDVVCC